jgi:hypothetical protein
VAVVVLDVQQLVLVNTMVVGQGLAELTLSLLSQTLRDLLHL